MWGNAGKGRLICKEHDLKIKQIGLYDEEGMVIYQSKFDVFKNDNLFDRRNR